jgi:lysophospholipase L1-like esterase
MRNLRTLIGVTVASAALASMGALLVGCSSPARHPSGQATPLPSSPRYYVSLGDSLSQGVQPNAFGQSELTADGYANKLDSVLQTRQAGWHLVKLGCSGETTETMIHGGICQYGEGSQLAQAERFLRQHRGHIGLITIDIGANDPNSCVIGAQASEIIRCMDGSIGKTTADLHTIMGGLRAAAGRTVPVIAMNYYVPELAGWLDGFTGQEIAALTERLVVGYNKILDRIYEQYGAHVANVFGAFHSSDFADKVKVTGYGVLPRNVATVCEWTWACARWPQGPNEHANNLGYGVMALAFLLADPKL